MCQQLFEFPEPKSFEIRQTADLCNLMDSEMGCLLVLQGNKTFVFVGRYDFSCTSVCMFVCVFSFLICNIHEFSPKTSAITNDPFVRFNKNRCYIIS